MAWRTPARLVLGVAGLALLLLGASDLYLALGAWGPSESLLFDVAGRPEVLRGAAIAAFGLACLFLVVVIGRSGRGQPAEWPAPPAADSIRATDAQIVLTGLLLNLVADADASHLETAPPLGARSEVMTRIAEALPGLEFDAAGKGHIERPGHHVRVSLDPGDPVPTAIVDARGDSSAVTAVRRLTASTGWRVFLPKRNAFVDTLADDAFRAGQRPGVGLD
jgi:hypothetical protein